VPKLVGEKKTQSDDVRSMSASVFFVLYPALADYVVSVLKRENCSHAQPTAHCLASETSSLPGPGNTSQMIDVTEASLKTEHVVPVATSPLLFPVLSLLCRLSPGLEVTDEGKRLELFFKSLRHISICFIPYLLTYKWKNFGQIFGLKVGGSTYTGVIKKFCQLTSYARCAKLLSLIKSKQAVCCIRIQPNTMGDGETVHLHEGHHCRIYSHLSRPLK